MQLGNSLGAKVVVLHDENKQHKQQHQSRKVDAKKVRVELSAVGVSRGRVMARAKCVFVLSQMIRQLSRQDDMLMHRVPYTSLTHLTPPSCLLLSHQGFGLRPDEVIATSVEKT